MTKMCMLQTFDAPSLDSKFTNNSTRSFVIGYLKGCAGEGELKLNHSRSNFSLSSPPPFLRVHLFSLKYPHQCGNVCMRRVVDMDKKFLNSAMHPECWMHCIAMYVHAVAMGECGSDRQSFKGEGVSGMKL